MKKLIEKYTWQINLFYTIVMLTVAVLLTIFNSETTMVPLVGGLLIIYAFYRLIQILRKKEKTVTIRLYLIEIGFQVLIGIFLIYIILFSEFELGVLFGYLIGGLLIIRGSLYFYGTRVQEHTEELTTFLMHIAAISAGTFLIVQGNFTPGIMSGIIISIALKRSFRTGMIAYKGMTQKSQEALPELLEKPSDDLDQIDWEEGK
jgi:hypothetical protein